MTPTAKRSEDDMRYPKRKLANPFAIHKLRSKIVIFQIGEKKLFWTMLKKPWNLFYKATHIAACLSLDDAEAILEKEKKAYLEVVAEDEARKIRKKKSITYDENMKKI